MKVKIICITFLLLVTIHAQTAIIEETGEKVSLYPDGTWEYQKETSNVEAIFKNWKSSIQNKNYDQYKALCSNNYVSSKVDNAEKFYEQAVAKNFSFQLEDKQERQTRAVFTVIILRNNREVDAIYLYFIVQEKTWIVDGINEDEKHAKLFLEGKISGSFHPKNLSSLAEIEVVAKLAMDGKANISELSRYVKINADTEKLLEYLATKKLYYKSNHYSPELNKAAIVFEYEESGNKGKEMIDICIYLKKQKSWLIYSRSSYLSNDEFLAEVYE